ncbi:bifunctional 3-(3-hydroxy-phenyl)propionate/3-hydroxycinnamic acid hydroxylase [Phenylobacterium sp.]|uniref:bifunctional 3-(3-hydroxy-phenyl)propionate/3-hydroxycinnamic acid hydroxylase MhpA n=1 Tax=Phenylobacterium sp. TaxID=1871053 RepID=UPI00289FB6FE|nr:bifunctional 3-(3-hydroxy-phenyl)propionate/3-hydroxycinnamic acid hydroxylase [Phenylobacterium sp.]
MRDDGFDCDVLIVGLGPVGAMLGVLLARSGVSTIAIDKDTAVYPLPRAAHFDHEIMRLFQQVGIAEEVARHARPAPAYEFRAADGQLLVRMDLPPLAPCGWASGYMFHQPAVETALRARLDESPLAQVRLAHRFTRLDQDAQGVSAVIAGPGGASSVRARYLVGCDGASSPVREAVGGELDDYRFDEPWLVLDAVVEDGARTPQVNLQICDPARPTTCVLMGPGRHRWEFMLLPGETPEQVLDDGFIAPLLAAWDCGPVRIERKAVYRFHGLVAKAWRTGRVLLAGDSAHQMPPFAGQGMCSGLRDAANLAWKLKAVLAGQADAALLDTYQVEREPHVRTYIELAIGMGRVVCTLDPQVAAQRDAGMLAQRAAGAAPLPPAAPAPLAGDCVMAGSPGAGALFPQPVAGTPERRLRLDDALGEGPWLITRTPAALDGAIDLADPRLAPFRAELAGWLDARQAAAVLVRPDRYVFGAGEPQDLAAAYRQALRPQVA